MGASQREERAPAAGSREALGQLASWWWVSLAAGIIWLIAGLIILQFRESSAATVGIIIGVLFLVAGLQEFAMASISSGWKWLWVIFGVLFLIGGIYALFNPVRTFAAVAQVLGFLFLLVGVFWTIEAFATMATNSLWWLGLIAGIMMIGLGFWAEGQFFPTRAYTLLVFAGVWALLHGITDIVRAFEIKQLGSILAS
jgi:uncharacterized membrane protein HdeD (DUF308 family)